MTRRLRIVSVCRSLPTPDDPSAGIFVRNRLQAMAERSELRAVQPLPYFPWVAPLPKWARQPTRQSGRLEVAQEPMFYLPGIAKSLDAMWLKRSVANRIATMHRDRAIDLIDAHFGYPDGVGCMHVARRLRVPYFITLRGFENEFVSRPRIGRSMLEAFRAATGLIAVSHSLRRLAIEHGIDADKVRVVHNAIDPKVFSAGDQVAARATLDLRDNVPLILSVGHLIPRKRHHVLIEAFAQLRRSWPAAQLVIIGSAQPDASCAARLHDQVAALGLQDTVQFVGNLPPGDVAQWLRASDLFALATAREGCCNAVLEALAVGVPVVTTPVGDNAEFVRNGENGLLCPVDDTAALADALQAGMQRRDWNRNAISANLHRQVGEWPEVAGRVLEFMGEMIGR